MRKPVAIVLCVAIGVVAIASLGFLAREQIRKTFLRTILFTTADPDVLGDFSSTSTEPMTVTIGLKRPEMVMTEGGQRASGRIMDRSLVLTAPAVYFSKIYLKEGPSGSQAVGFSVWSKKFDPALADVVESQKIMMKAATPDRPKTPVEQRTEATGEYVLTFETGNNFRNERKEQQASLRAMAGGNDESRPCDRGFDSELGMVTFRAPEGRKAGQRTCQDIWSGNAVGFLKLNEDGSARFSVFCSGNGPRGHPPDITTSGKPWDPLCRMSGNFGGWAFQAHVPYRQRADWVDVFDRIQAFLSKTATEKIGRQDTL
jgi:hypothetical protein